VRGGQHPCNEGYLEAGRHERPASDLGRGSANRSKRGEGVVGIRAKTVKTFSLEVHPQMCRAVALWSKTIKTLNAGQILHVMVGKELTDSNTEIKEEIMGRKHRFQREA